MHAVKTRSQPISKRSLNVPTTASIEEDPNEEPDSTKPLAQTLTDLQFSDSARDNVVGDKGRHKNCHFNQLQISLIVTIFISLAESDRW